MSVKERNKPSLERILEIKAEHTFSGYRRTWAYRIIQGKKLLVTKNMRSGTNSL